MQLERRHLIVEGQRREYLLAAPAGVPSPCPLVFAFHGAGSNAEDMRQFCQLDAKAEQSRFAVVFPEGTGRTDKMRSWNAGAPHVFAAEQGVDDVLFFERLCEEIVLEIGADPNHIFLTGMSNGGLLCYHLANSVGHLIAGIAPVSCATLDSDIRCIKPMPVIHIHGTKDQVVPYQGGTGGRSAAGSEFVPVERMVAAWAAHNGCSAEPENTPFEPRVADGTSISRQLYRGALGANSVILYTVHEGGHTWPGVCCAYEFLGTATQNLVANDVIWEFFAATMEL